MKISSLSAYRAQREKRADIAKSNCRRVLASLGWETSASNLALAKFQVMTFRGPQPAWVQLQQGSADDPNFLISAVYYSEGRNILDPCLTCLPVNASEQATAQVLERFNRHVQEALGNSYGVRIAKVLPPPDCPQQSAA